MVNPSFYQLFFVNWTKPNVKEPGIGFCPFSGFIYSLGGVKMVKIPSDKKKSLKLYNWNKKWFAHLPSNQLLSDYILKILFYFYLYTSYFYAVWLALLFVITSNNFVLVGKLLKFVRKRFCCTSENHNLNRIDFRIGQRLIFFFLLFWLKFSFT